MIRLTMAVTIAALLAGAAFAGQDPATPSETGAATAAPATEAVEGDDDPLKIICRRVRPPTGTRVAGPQTRQQMCMTQSDWEQQELDAQEALKVRDEGTCSPGQCSG